MHGDTKDFTWRDDRLFCRGRATGFRIVPDTTYPTMWRVERPDGTRTDMVNRTRAKDAAQGLAMAVNRRAA